MQPDEETIAIERQNGRTLYYEQHGLLDKQQRAAAIKSMEALAEEQKRRAAAIPKKPLPGEKLETPVRTVR